MKTSEIASQLNGKLSGDPDLEIESVSNLESLRPGQLGFFDGVPGPGVLDSLPEDACLLISAENPDSFSFTTIKVKNPKTAFARITADLVPRNTRSGIHSTFVAGRGSAIHAAYIGAGVSVGENTTVGEGAYLHDGVRLGDNVSIGPQSVIHMNSVVYDNCRIGADCILHAGAVIGAAGFGYLRDGGEIIRFPQIGIVVIEDRVEIGANSCVDRGALGETRIGSDSKIDNLVQIAHNVSIGARVLIAAHVGISGSVVIEDDVVIGGQAGIGDHATIKKGAVLGGRSTVYPGKILKAGIWAGNPVQPIERHKEQKALIHSLRRLKKEIKEIRKRLD